MTVTPTFEVRPRTVSNGTGPTSQTVVAIPPSDLDAAGKMRVAVNGILTTRDYDETMEQP